MKTKMQLLEEAYLCIQSARTGNPSFAHLQMQKAFALIEMAKQVP